MCVCVCVCVCVCFPALTQQVFEHSLVLVPDAVKCAPAGPAIWQGFLADPSSTGRTGTNPDMGRQSGPALPRSYWPRLHMPLLDRYYGRDLGLKTTGTCICNALNLKNMQIILISSISVVRFSSDFHTRITNKK